MSYAPPMRRLNSFTIQIKREIEKDLMLRIPRATRHPTENVKLCSDEWDAKLTNLRLENERLRNERGSRKRSA